MKYLAVLAVLFLAGCASVSDSSTSATSTKSSNGYRDYSYTTKDGVVKIHRIYNNGSQEWLDQASAK